MSKDFTFVSRQFSVKHAFPLTEIENTTFDEIADRLYRQLLSPDDVYKSVIEKRENILPDPQREGVFKFFYVTESGHIPIARVERILDFYERTGKSEVYFFVDVIGGAQSAQLTIGVLSEYVFLAHALDLRRDPQQFGFFQILEYEKNRFRISKVSRDRFRRVVHVYVQPTPLYPRSPPVVVSSPSVIDPCFAKGGRLDWAYARGSLTSVWDLTSMDKNPLIYLFDELFVKYRLTI